MWVMSSVLSPLMARMVSPGHRSPRAALLPGVTWGETFTHTHTREERAVRTGVKLSVRKKHKEEERKRELGSGCQHEGQIQQKQPSSD